jgi:hypothetical protein
MIAKNKLFGQVNRKLFALAAVLLSIGFFQPVYSATLLTDLQQGVEFYNSKKYSDAVGHLQLHLGAHPNDAVARYYLANSLKNLGYDEPSLVEYQRALTSSTSPQLSGYCRQAIQLAAASKQIRAGVASQPFTGEPAFMTEAFVGTPRLARRLMLNTTHEERVAQALARMQSARQVQVVQAPAAQSELEPRDGKGLQDLVLARALDRMKEQSNDQLEIFAKNKSIETQAIMEHLNADISSPQLAGRIQQLKEKAQADLEKEQDENTRLARKFQADVRNLQNQLAESRRLPGDPNLQLVGTDVYTRVYASSSGEPLREPPPPDELLATPERLVLDAHSHPGRTISRVVRDPSPPERQHIPGTDLNVHGQLVRP